MFASALVTRIYHWEWNAMEQGMYATETVVCLCHLLQGASRTDHRCDRHLRLWPRATVPEEPRWGSFHSTMSETFHRFCQKTVYCHSRRCAFLSSARLLHIFSIYTLCSLHSTCQRLAFQSKSYDQLLLGAFEQGRAHVCGQTSASCLLWFCILAFYLSPNRDISCCLMSAIQLITIIVQRQRNF